MSLSNPDPTVQADNRTTLELGQVLPKTAQVIDGDLHVGGVNLVELARNEGTALYVLDENDIRSRLKAFKDGMATAYPNSEVVYAGKSLAIAAVFNIVKEEGAWLDVSSGGEFELARRVNFPLSHVMVHGNNKTRREIREAISAGAGQFVVDTTEELARINEIAGEYGVKQPVLLRITPGVVAGEHSYIQTGSEDSKFGFTIKDEVAHNALNYALGLPNLDVRGFHMHIGSQLLATEPFEPALKIMATFIEEVKERFGFVTEELDVGGGFAIAYEPEEEPLEPQVICQRITSIVSATFEERGLKLPKLFIEPGRAITGTAGVTLYEVGSIKEIAGVRTYVNVDGGMSDNIRPALYDAIHQVTIANKADQPRTEVVTVAGKHCESGDVLAVDTSLQKTEPGDILAVFSTGAYTYAMASNYNLQPRPAIYLLNDGVAKLVVRRESYDDLFSQEIFEA